jgi:alginate O-acetyltransferase complex protein AlgI
VLFNSLEFFAFFAVVVGLYFAVPPAWRKAWLLGWSFYFYMSWAPAFIALILYTTTIDYFVARRLDTTEGARARRAWLLLSITTNLAALFFFKYYNFVAANWAAVADWLGTPSAPPLLHIILPLGISFYTFEALSYTFDVYRRRYPAERSYSRLLLFIMFFPKLIAGPIERAGHLIPQFELSVTFDYERARNGFVQILWGLFKKVVVADRLAIYVDAVYNHADRHVGSSFALATLLFAFQIYCDFSGYSDIAIGTARVLGIDLLRNFRRPYFATSPTEFWSRWHMSLSTWFRDYLYVPLGGNRRGAWRTTGNIVFVFLVSGVWHGANWTFVWWGGFHGAYIFLQHMWNRFGRPVLPQTPAAHWAKVAGTFAVVCLSWVLFRANSLGDAVHIYRQMFTNFGPGELYLGNNAAHLVYGLAGIAALVGAELTTELGLYPRIWLPAFKPVRWVTYAAAVLALLLFGVFDGGQFIYFQF